MADNDIILLNTILEQKKKQVANSLADDDFFEIFTFEQILKNYELSYEEFISGKIGGGDDGGIDGFFAFINEELLDEDTDISTFKKNPTIVLFLIQAKRSPSFSEIAVERAITTVEEIFDLTKDMSVLRSIYNANLIDKAEMFRKAYLELDETSDILNQALSELIQIAQKYATSQGNQPINTIAKSKAFVTFLINEYNSVLNQVEIDNILTEGK